MKLTAELKARSALVTQSALQLISLFLFHCQCSCAINGCAAVCRHAPDCLFTYLQRALVTTLARRSASRDT